MPRARALTIAGGPASTLRPLFFRNDLNPPADAAPTSGERGISAPSMLAPAPALSGSGDTCPPASSSLAETSPVPSLTLTGQCRVLTGLANFLSRRGVWSLAPHSRQGFLSSPQLPCWPPEPQSQTGKTLGILTPESLPSFYECGGHC